MEIDTFNNLSYFNRISPKALGLGLRDTVQGVEPEFALPALIVVAPAIGALATNVTLCVHGKYNHLNILSYICGDAASGKGQANGLVRAWMHELIKERNEFLVLEEENKRQRKRDKNKKEQIDESRFPIRYLTLNNTVPNLAVRLENAQGKHSFSFSDESDAVTMKWKSSINEFSVILRQAYDATSYDREAKSLEAASVHIDKLLLNIALCGTCDALYRMTPSSTDGLLTRLAIARTNDNTFEELSEVEYSLTDKNIEHIKQVAHLLPFMEGRLRLQKLENAGREWLKKILRMCILDYDRVTGKARMRICVTTQRIVTAFMLANVAGQLIRRYGVDEAEKMLKADRTLTEKLVKRMQKPEMLAMFDVIADYLLDNMLYFNYERISAGYNIVQKNGMRQRRGKNDSIFERLPMEFTLEEARMVRGDLSDDNALRQMIKNWKKCGLIENVKESRWRKK